MADTPLLSVEPLEQTYSEEVLSLVESLPERVDLGRYRDPTDGRDFRAKLPVERSLDMPEHDDANGSLIRPVNAPAKMPNKLTLARRTGPVVDQKLTPRCVTYSGAGVKQQHERREHRRTFVVEPDDWYGRTKQIDPWGPHVDGTGIRYACQIAHRDGVLMDDPRSKKDDPWRRHKIGAYVRLGKLEEVLTAVARNYAVWFGISVDRGIFTPYRTSQGFVVPPPDGRPIGGHAMLIVGYWLSMGWLLVKNSWGERYGDQGYVWMPLAHFRQYGDWDAWTVTDSLPVA